MKKIVKLYVYQFEKEKTMVGIEEAEDYGDFMIVSVDTLNHPAESFEGLYNGLVNSFPDKKIIMIDKNLDIAFYGVKEVDELGELNAG